MSFGDGGAGDAARAQRQEEIDRQNRIKDGMAEIDRIFGGGAATRRGVGAVTAPAEGGTYYLADGSTFTVPRAPTGSAPLLSPADYEFLRQANDNGLSTAGSYVDTLLRNNGGQPRTASPEMQKAQELAAAGKLFSGEQDIPASAGFDDNFFNQRKQAYLDYADPQLEDQYRNQQKDLTFALARNGLLKSSVAADKVGKLTKQYNLNRDAIAGQADDLVRQTRGDIEQSRAELAAGLQSSADPAEASRSALAASSRLAMQPSFSPLGQLFSDVTSGLVANADRQRYNTPISATSPSLFGRGSSSRVVS